RGELREISKAEWTFYIANPFDSIFVTILPELLLLDFFKLVSHLVELLFRECVFPSWEDDCVFERRVMFIHAHETDQSLCHTFTVRRAEFSICGNRDYVVGDLAAASVLR